jgi:hypothetical protein
MCCAKKSWNRLSKVAGGVALAVLGSAPGRVSVGGGREFEGTDKELGEKALFSGHTRVKDGRE